MKSINYDEIEKKHQKLIDIAKNYMYQVSDYEHDINHVFDVISYTKELANTLNIDCDYEVLIISAYWHDVGRIECKENHEKLSANMLKEVMEENNYEPQMIDACYKAIVNHKWDMKPVTTEGLIIKDADKLAWLGIGRWSSCLKNNQKLDEIIKLLPRLKKEILYFKESKEIYDREIIELIKFLYENNFK